MLTWKWSIRGGGISVIVAALLVGLPAALRAQDDATPPPGTLSGPSFGGTSPSISPPPRIITGSQNADILRHRDFAGKPCLGIGGFARAHTGDSKLFDHMIEIKNNCSQSIRTQVCYLHTQECITLEVAGHMTKQGILGTLPSIKDFQYEFRERF
jgi:hypothetical protein